MNFDDLLKEAWTGETRPPAAPYELTRRVRRQQQRQRLLRAGEAALTGMALLVFGRAIANDGIAPSHWLLMPFFVVFLPVIWTLVLRTPRRRADNATECVSAYARLRLLQLRTSLRDLWLARIAARVLLGYAAMTSLGVWLLAGDDWQRAGAVLLAFAVLWFSATLWLSHHLRRKWLREYRAVHRLVGRQAPPD